LEGSNPGDGDAPFPENMEDDMSIEAHIDSLRAKHSHLEEDLRLALQSPSIPDADIAEIKRRKLQLKDEIARHGGTTH
jgi:hypothetical protein